MTAPVPAPTSPWAPLLALLERTWWQAAMVFVSALAGAGALGADAVAAAGIAAVAAGLTVLANGVPTLAIPEGLPWYVDLALRVARSFASAFLAPILAAMAGAELTIETVGLALFGGAVAALTVLKGAITTWAALRGHGALTPATLPARLDLPPPAPTAGPYRI